MYIHLCLPVLEHETRENAQRDRVERSLVPWKAAVVMKRTPNSLNPVINSKGYIERCPVEPDDLPGTIHHVLRIILVCHLWGW